MLIVINSLSSCKQISYNNCPLYPVAGKQVAVELSQAGNLPYTWEWIGRINKLRQELELCKNNKI